MRASLPLIFFSLALPLALFNAACKPSSPKDTSAAQDEESARLEEQPEQEEEQLEMDLDEKGRPLVAQGGVVRLTVDDVLQGAERLRLISPRMEDGRLIDEDLSWLKAVPAQATLVQNLIHFQILRHLADERGLTITDQDETTFIAENEALRPFLPLFQDGPEAEELTQTLGAVGLTIDDVRHLAHDMILEEKFVDQLAQNFPDSELWSIYQANQDLADLIIVQMSNTPTSEEVDLAVQEKDAEIRAFYRDNRARFFIPGGTFATILQARRDMDPATAENTLKEAQKRLEAGQEPQKVADDLELILREDTRLVAAADRAANQAEIGQLGITLTGPRGPHLWRVESRRDDVQRKLDRPLLREIGAELLRQEKITPSNQARAQEIQKIFANMKSTEPLSESQVQALVKEISALDQRLQVHHTGLFGLRSDGFIPQLGISEELTAAVRDLTFESPVTTPLLDRERILIARLVDRQPPTREKFEAHRDEFRADFLAQNRHLLADRAIQLYGQEQGVKMNLAPLGEHLGPPEPKGL